MYLLVWRGPAPPKIGYDSKLSAGVCCVSGLAPPKNLQTLSSSAGMTALFWFWCWLQCQKCTKTIENLWFLYIFDERRFLSITMKKCTVGGGVWCKKPSMSRPRLFFPQRCGRARHVPRARPTAGNYFRRWRFAPEQGPSSPCSPAPGGAGGRSGDRARVLPRGDPARRAAGPSLPVGGAEGRAAVSATH